MTSLLQAGLVRESTLCVSSSSGTEGLWGGCELAFGSANLHQNFLLGCDGEQSVNLLTILSHLLHSTHHYQMALVSPGGY